MRITYDILWPGGNTTAVVDQKIPRSQHADTAWEIMRRDPSIEQVGFLEKPTSSAADCRIQMMGGEFCGNAARSAAFLWGKLHERESVKIEVSGFPAVLDTELTETYGELILPGTFCVHCEMVPEGYIVSLRGVRHLIVPANLEEPASSLIEKYKCDSPAIGIMFTSIHNNALRIQPMVWVRDTDTLVHETGCGSGSIATAIAMKERGYNHQEFKILQPSGVTYDVTLLYGKDGLKHITLGSVIEHRGLKRELIFETPSMNISGNALVSAKL